MNRDLAKAVLRDVDAALAAVATRHGLTALAGRGAFDPTIGTLRVNVTFEEAASAKEQFERFARAIGISPSAFGQTFAFANKQYTVSGCLPKAAKRPILAREVGGNGQEYRFPVTIAVGLGETSTVVLTETKPSDA